MTDAVHRLDWKKGQPVTAGHYWLRFVGGERAQRFVSGPSLLDRTVTHHAIPIVPEPPQLDPPRDGWWMVKHCGWVVVVRVKDGRTRVIDGADPVPCAHDAFAWETAEYLGDRPWGGGTPYHEAMP